MEMLTSIFLNDLSKNHIDGDDKKILSCHRDISYSNGISVAMMALQQAFVQTTGLNCFGPPVSGEDFRQKSIILLMN